MTHAIPTVYRGIQFRSRLEARWAAFFDLAMPSWKWRYEPIDLRGWIPDFDLSASESVDSFLVEIKPARSLFDLWQYVGKVERAICPGLDGYDKSFTAKTLRSAEERLTSEQGKSGEEIREIMSGYGVRVAALLGEAPSLLGDADRDVATELYGDKMLWGLWRVEGGISAWTASGIRLETDATPAWIEAGNLVQYKAPGR